VAAGILVQDALGYRFAHEFQRRSAAAGAPDSERRRYHRRLAAALASQPFRGRDYLRIGAHWAAAGEPGRAIACLGFGARRAAATLAVGDALAALEQALQLATAQQPEGAPWSARAVNLSLQRIELLSVVADHESLLRAERQLASSATTTAAYARARSALLMAQSSRVVGDYAGAELALARSGAAVAQALETQSLRLNRAWLDTQIVGAFTAYTRRDLPTMRRRLTRMAESVRRWGTPDQRASYLVWRANYQVLRSRYAYNPLAVRLERHAFRILTRVASRSRDAVYCQFDLAFMLLLGDRQACAESSELLLDAELAAKRLADAVLGARVATYQAIALRRLRDPRRCEHYAKLASTLAETCQLRGYLGAVTGCLAWVALRTGELAQARRLCDEADAHFHASDGHAATEYPFQWLALLPRLAADMSEDRLEDALVTVRRLLRRTQARLAEPLDLALQALASEWSELDDGAIARRLSAVIRLATVHGYL
jgi:hypothetical protein